MIQYKVVHSIELDVGGHKTVLVPVGGFQLLVYDLLRLVSALELPVIFVGNKFIGITRVSVAYTAVFAAVSLHFLNYLRRQGHILS